MNFYLSPPYILPYIGITSINPFLTIEFNNTLNSKLTLPVFSKYISLVTQSLNLTSPISILVVDNLKS